MKTELPSTVLSKAHAGYGIELDPTSARLVVVGQVVSGPLNRKLSGVSLGFKQAGWNLTPDGQSFWDAGSWLACVSWDEGGDRREELGAGVTPDAALASLEETLLAQIQDPDTLAAAQAAVREALGSREEIPSNLRRPGS
jgi:hypothetical protein